MLTLKTNEVDLLLILFIINTQITFIDQLELQDSNLMPITQSGCQPLYLHQNCMLPEYKYFLSLSNLCNIFGNELESAQRSCVTSCILLIHTIPQIESNAISCEIWQRIEANSQTGCKNLPAISHILCLYSIPLHKTNLIHNLVSRQSQDTIICQ